MRTYDELQRRIASYRDVDFVYLERVGYAAWHLSTGDNVELLFIEAVSGKGYIPLIGMVDRLLEKGPTPYHSVFAFRLGSNVAAGRFYAKLGWTQQELGRSIYRDDETVLAWIVWKDLLDNLKPFRGAER